MSSKNHPTTNPYLIGITGMTGSGKTYVIDSLQKKFGQEILVISQDNYYKDTSRLGLERWERANYDRPTAFDNGLLIRDLHKLLARETIESLHYDYQSKHRSKAVKKLTPRPIIIVEGIMIFAIDELLKLFDLKVYLESDGDVRLARRILRDFDERGVTIADTKKTIQWYLTQVKPNQEKYILPAAKKADLIIDTNEGGFKAVVILEKRIRKILGG